MYLDWGGVNLPLRSGRAVQLLGSNVTASGYCEFVTASHCGRILLLVFCRQQGLAALDRSKLLCPCTATAADESAIS